MNGKGGRGLRIKGREIEVGGGVTYKEEEMQKMEKIRVKWDRRIDREG